MANQESRLAIVIDSKQAEQNIKRLRTALKNVGKESLDASAGIELLASSLNPLKAYDKLFSQAAQASREMTKSVRLLSRETDRASKGFSDIAQKAKSGTVQTQKLSNAMQGVAMQASNLSNKSKVVSKDLNDVDKTSNRLAESFGKLKSIAIGVFAGIGFNSVLRAADTMQSLNSQVRLVTNSIQEFNAVQFQLSSISNRQYTDIESLTQLYTRSRRALEQLGKTQQQTLDFTNNIAMAMRVGGASAQEQSAALLQLSQALASGVLRGEEFNSIAEQAPILLSLVAKEMGVTQGALRKLAADGKITSEIVYNAVANATESLEQMSSKMPVTVGQSLTVLKNTYKNFVGDFINDTTGLSGALAQSIKYIADNFNVLAKVLAGAATSWGVYTIATSSFVTSTIPEMIAGLQATISGIVAQTNATQGAIASTLSLSSIQDALTASIYRVQQARVVATLTLQNYKLVLLESIAVMKAKTASIAGALLVQAQYTASLVTSGSLLSIFSLSVKGAVTSLTAKAGALAANIQANAIYAASLVSTNGVVGASVLGVRALTNAIISKTIAMANAIRSTSVYSLAIGGLGAVASTAGKGIVGLGVSIGRVATVLKAHPILALAGTIFTVIAATDGLSAAMESLSDAIAVVGIIFADFVKGTVSWIKELAATFNNFISGFIQGSVDGVSESAGAFGWLFSTTEGGFLGLLQVIANVFDGAARVVGTFAVTVGKGIYNLGVSIGNNAKGMANVLIRAFNWAGNAIARILNSIIDKANSAIKLVNKIPGVDIGTIEAKVRFKQVGEFSAAPKLDNSIKGNWDAVGNAVNLYGARAKLDKAIYKYTYNKLKKENASADLDILTAPVNALGDAIDNTGKKAKKAGGKAKKAAKKAKDGLTEAQKAAEKLAEAFAKATASLDKSIASIGISTEFEKWRIDLSDATNELSKLDEISKKLLLSKAVDLDVAQASNDFKKQNTELRNQIELLGVKDDYQKELLKIQQSHNQMLSQYNVLLEAGYEGAYNKVVAEANVTKELREQLALTQARQSANDAFYNLKDSMQEDSPMGKLVAEFEQRKEIIRAANEFEVGTAKERADALLAIEQSFMDKKRDLMLTQSQDLFSGLSGLAKSFAGEQSGIYRALFAVEKGFAIYRSILAVKTSIAKAMEAGIDPVTRAANMASAAAQGASIISDIKSIAMPVGQAHDGIMTVPKSGTWNLEKGERVLPQHTAKALDKKLASNDSKVIVNNYTSEKAEVKKDVDGNTIVEIGKMVNNMVDSKISSWERRAKRQGGVLSA